jgi:site-specific DNA-methyltransferase (adenine-specific)
MKFDFIIGNPPYNTPKTNSTNQTQDLYDKFVERFYPMANEGFMFVMPSRWFSKSMMKSFREFMCKIGVKELISKDPLEVFKHRIKGGVSYFYAEKNYEGDTLVDGISCNLQNINNSYGVLLFLPEIACEILEKVKPLPKIKNYCAKSTFGVKTNDSGFGKGTIRCKVSRWKGHYTTIERVKSNEHLLDKWKVVFPMANGDWDNFIDPNCISIEPPGTAISESFIFFYYDTKQQAENMRDYFNLPVVRWLISLRKTTHSITSEVFSLVPDADSSRKYHNSTVIPSLTDDERFFINSQLPENRVKK